MKFLFKFLVLTILLACFSLFLVANYSILGRSVISPDEKFRFQYKSTVELGILRPVPGNCGPKWTIKLENSDGKLLYSSEDSEGYYCLPKVLFLPGKVLILDTYFSSLIDRDGNRLKKVEPHEFEKALWLMTKNDRDQIIYSLSDERWGLKDEFLIAVVYRLLSPPDEDLRLASHVASLIDLKKHRAKMVPALNQFIATDIQGYNNSGIAREYFEKFFSDSSKDDYLKGLKTLFFQTNNESRITTGIDVVSESKRMSLIEKKNLLLECFNSPNSFIEEYAMQKLIKSGLGNEILEKILSRYYLDKGGSDFYQNSISPGKYLNAMISISQKGNSIRKAIVFGLEHSKEDYWREAFYLVRDNDQLNDRALIPSLLALKAKHKDDSLIVEQVDRTVARIQNH